MSSGRPPPACLTSSTPPPSCRVVCLQHTLHYRLRTPSSSCRVVCRPPTARQYCHRFVTVSSSSPLPLSSSRPLPALACRQHEDITTTIANTTYSSPMNEGVHHRKESHGICHSCGTSSGMRNIVGIAPSPNGAATAPPLQAIPRRQRASCPGDSHLPATTLPPAPLTPCHSRADHVPGEGSPLAMKRSIRKASASSDSGVRHHLLLYNSANQPTHQFCSLRD